MKKRKMKLFVISILLVLVLLSLLNFISGGGEEECAPNSKTNIYNYFGSRCAPCSTKGFSTTGGNLVNSNGILSCYYCDDYSSCASPDKGTRTEVCPAPISSCCETLVETYRCQNNTNEDDPSGYYIPKKEKYRLIGTSINGATCGGEKWTYTACSPPNPIDCELDDLYGPCVWDDEQEGYYQTQKILIPESNGGVCNPDVIACNPNLENCDITDWSECYEDSSGKLIQSRTVVKLDDSGNEVCEIIFKDCPIPEVKEAYWTNNNGQIIFEASLGDTVFMNAMAATGSSITMQQFIKYLLGWRGIGGSFVPSLETQISIIDSIYSKDTQFFEKGTYKFKASLDESLPGAQYSPTPFKESGELEIVEGENSLPVAKIIKIMQDAHVLENSGEGLRESNTQNLDIFFATGIPIEFFQNSSDVNDKLTLKWSMGTGIGSYSSGNVGMGSTYGDSEPEKIFIIPDYSIREKNSKDLEDGRYLGDVLHTYNNPGGYTLKLSVTEQFDETLIDRSPITNEVSVFINLVRVGINVMPEITFPKNYFTVGSDKGTKIKFNANKTYVLDCRLKNQVEGEEDKWCEDPFGIELETYPEKCCRYVHHQKLGINRFTNTKLDRGYELNLTWIIVPEKTYNDGFLKNSYYWNGDLESACNLVSLDPLLENCIVISGSWYENYTDVVEFEKTFPSPIDNEQLKYRVFLRAIYRDCIGERGCWDGN